MKSLRAAYAWGIVSFLIVAVGGPAAASSTVSATPDAPGSGSHRDAEGPRRVAAPGAEIAWSHGPTLASRATSVALGDDEDDENEDGEDGEEKDLPLEAARTVSMTAESGSWISVDVSPDGETVVFDLLGDLYTVPIGGGEATRVTEGMAFDGQPRYSPDGERILFVSDRNGGENLWILDLGAEDDGERLHRLTKGKTRSYATPDWLHCCDSVVASRSKGLFGSEKLWMWHVDGGSGVQLIDEPESLRTLGASPTPDGRHLYFAQRQGQWDYNATLPQYQIAMYDRETGERYTRTYRYGSAFRPTLSPDGRWLVYGTRYEEETGLRIRELESGEERWLAYPVQHDDQESRATRDVLPGMSFTPDSSALVVSYGGGIWRVPVDGADPVRIPFTAEVELGIGPEVDFDYPVEDSPEFVVRQIRDAVPSPEGDRLAFTALDQLHVMRWPDGEPRRLTGREGVEAHPTWSPDGSWIAYVTWSREEGGHVYKVPADGGDPVRLTETPAIYQQVAWSPDGERLVAIRGPARAYRRATGPFAPGAADDLVWIPADGGDARTIAPSDGRSEPHFVADEPDRVYLHHSEKGLLSIRFDGTDEKAHVRVEGATLPGADEPTTAGVVKMAPRGDLALARVTNDLYVVTVPYVGGETPTVSVADPEGASVPVRKLTRVGGQFPAWGSTGRVVHWSIGNAHFVYDLDEAEAAEERAEREAEEARDEEDAEEDPGDETDEEGEDGEEDGDEDESPEEEEAGGEEEGDEDDGPVYEPRRVRVEITARRDVPEGVTVLRGARVITMVDDRVIEDADVVVRDNRIEAVGPRGGVEVPEGAEIVDVSGKTIIPGLVDTHAHMWPAWGIHKSQVWMYLVNLAYGVTTTRDPQTATTDVLTYADRVEAGELIGPRIYSTGPGVFFSEQIEDLDHARDILKRYSEYYDTKTIKMYMTGNRQQRQWVIMAAREQELMPTTEGGLDFKMNLTLMVDGYPGLEHSLPIFPFYDDVVTLAADTRIAYTPTLLVAYGGPWAENYFYTRHEPYAEEKLHRFYPWEELAQRTRRRAGSRGGWFMEEEHAFPEIAAQARKIVEAGGRVGVGSHGQLDGLGYHWELWALQSGGMSEYDALRCATILGARAIGLDGDLGSIEAGKLSDLVVLDENPLEDIHNTEAIAFVMKNGRLYDGDTLDEIQPRQRRLEIPWDEERPEPRAGIRD